MNELFFYGVGYNKQIKKAYQIVKLAKKIKINLILFRVFNGSYKKLKKK